jgi:hypothetical protein
LLPRPRLHTLVLAIVYAVEHANPHAVCTRMSTLASIICRPSACLSSLSFQMTRLSPLLMVRSPHGARTRSHTRVHTRTNPSSTLWGIPLLAYACPCMPMHAHAFTRLLTRHELSFHVRHTSAL